MKLGVILTLAATAVTVMAAAIKRGDAYKGAYLLRAHLPGHFIDNKKWQALNRQFVLGPDRPSTGCPPGGGVYGIRCPPGDDTVLGNGILSVIVPGGQKTFIKNTGAFSFTTPHSGAMPDMVTTSTQAGIDMNFYGPYGVQWAACKMDPSASGGTGEIWQVFARIPDFKGGPDCVEFETKVEPYNNGVNAWQYE